MTTLLGIKTNSGEEAVVLVTDTQITLGEDEKNKNRKPIYKMANGSFWALGFMGNQWDGSRKFYNKLTSPKRYKDIEKLILDAIENKRFMEVDTLNAEFMRTYEDGLDGTMEFLFATNKPKVELYLIDSFGNMYTLDDLENHESVIVRSTTTEIEESIMRTITERIQGDDIGSDERIDLESALKLAYYGMQKVDLDVYSSGPIDITVITKDGVVNYGKQIRKAISDAEHDAFNKILKEYKKEESRSPDSN